MISLITLSPLSSFTHPHIFSFQKTIDISIEIFNDFYPFFESPFHQASKYLYRLLFTSNMVNGSSVVIVWCMRTNLLALMYQASMFELLFTIFNRHYLCAWSAVYCICNIPGPIIRWPRRPKTKALNSIAYWAMENDQSSKRSTLPFSLRPTISDSPGSIQHHILRISTPRPVGSHEYIKGSRKILFSSSTFVVHSRSGNISLHSVSLSLESLKCLKHIWSCNSAAVSS